MTKFVITILPLFDEALFFVFESSKQKCDLEKTFLLEWNKSDHKFSTKIDELTLSFWRTENTDYKFQTLDEWFNDQEMLIE